MKEVKTFEVGIDPSIAEFLENRASLLGYDMYDYLVKIIESYGFPKMDEEGSNKVSENTNQGKIISVRFKQINFDETWKLNDVMKDDTLSLTAFTTTPNGFVTLEFTDDCCDYNTSPTTINEDETK